MLVVISLLIFVGLAPNVLQVIPTIALIGAAFSAIPFLFLTTARTVSSTYQLVLLFMSVFVFVFVSLLFGVNSPDLEAFGSFVAKPAIFAVLFLGGCLAVDKLSERQILFCLYFMAAFVLSSITFQLFKTSFGLYFGAYDPNFMSISLCATLLVGIKTGRSIITIASLVLIALTFSRMGAAAAVALLLGNLRFDRVISFRSFVILLPCLYFLLIAPDNIISAAQVIRLPSKIVEADNLATAILDSARWELWKDSLEALEMHPFGVGAGMSPYYVGLDIYISEDVFKSGAPGNLPHNTYLMMFLEYGILFGMVQIFCFLYFVFVANRFGKLFFAPVSAGIMLLLDVHFQSPFWLLLLTVRWLNVYVCNRRP